MGGRSKKTKLCKTQLGENQIVHLVVQKSGSRLSFSTNGQCIGHVQAERNFNLTSLALRPSEGILRVYKWSIWVDGRPQRWVFGFQLKVEIVSNGVVYLSALQNRVTSQPVSSHLLSHFTNSWPVTMGGSSKPMPRAITRTVSWKDASGQLAGRKTLLPEASMSQGSSVFMPVASDDTTGTALLETSDVCMSH